MLERVLWNIGLITLAVMLLAVKTSPWLDIGIGLLILGSVLTLFTIRDAIVLALQRSGRSADRDRVLVHLGAVIMAMIAAPAFFSDAPRVHSVRWYLMVGLPLSLYLFSFLWGVMTRCLFGRNDAA
jgi:hypothetical protein